MFFCRKIKFTTQIFFVFAYIFELCQYIGAKVISHMGVSPKWVKSKRRREKKKKKEREKRLNDGNNNGQATHRARKPPGPKIKEGSRVEKEFWQFFIYYWRIFITQGIGCLKNTDTRSNSFNIITENLSDCSSGHPFHSYSLPQFSRWQFACWGNRPWPKQIRDQFPLEYPGDDGSNH